MNFIKKKEMYRSIEKRLFFVLSEIKRIQDEGKAKGIEDFYKIVSEEELKKMQPEELEFHIARVAMRDEIELHKEEVQHLKNQMFGLDEGFEKKELSRDQWEKKLARKLENPDKV